MEPSTPVGERIAYYRRRRGLSQVKLARLLGRSESWLSQVERGARQIDRVSVLVEVAAALDVPVAELTPEAFLPEAPEEHPTARAVREVLSRPDVLGWVLAPRADGKEKALIDVEGLESRAERAWELTHASRYAGLTELLPVLIPEGEALAREARGSKRKRAFGALAAIYEATAAIMAKVQAADLGWVAAERAIVAAERAEAPLHVAAAEFRLSHVFLSANQAELALQTARAAAEVLRPRVAGGPPELVSLWGALNLAAAVAAVRARQESVARECMANAEEAARVLGADRNDFHTEFGPTNVALHAVSIAVELGDAGEALRRAEDIEPSNLSPERRARFLIDVARAYGQRRRVGEAVRVLEEAETLTPEQVRSYPAVRQLVRDLLRAGRRHAQDSDLRALARRVGVLH